MADERGEPSTLVASIDDGTKGRWQITTETGSTYLVDLDQRVITRVPELRALRRDHEPLLLRRVIEARVGDTGCFLVQIRSDDVPTLRLTSHIVGIVRLPAAADREEGAEPPWSQLACLVAETLPAPRDGERRCAGDPTASNS